MSPDSNDSGVCYKALEWISSYYRVGTDGSVWSCHNNRWGAGPWKQLKGFAKGKFGHLQVCLWVDGKEQWHAVHRLILEAFVGPCPEGMEACHFPDRNPANNRLDNLRWDTPANNQRDKIAHGTYQYGAKNPLATLTEEQVKEMRRLREDGWPLKRLAEKFSVCIMTACNIVNRKTWATTE